MKKFAGILLLWWMLPWTVSGQLEASNWFFGERAGLDFHPAPVRPQRGNLSTIEGCSSFSHANGDLILYTDGITVYDAMHNIMPNGRGLTGDPSSTQSGLIVPHPGNPNLFYIITVDDSGGNGLRFSLVDLNLRGGLGDVVAGQKNIRLIDGAEEKVTAVANYSQNFVWVITLAPDPIGGNTTIPIATGTGPARNVYAIKFDSNGITPQAVRTTLPISHSRMHGYLKVSPQGNKLAMAFYYEYALYLADFDINTGQVSNFQSLPLPTNFGPYGVEFSPDGNLLYAAGTYGASTRNSRIALLQYNLTSTPYTYTILTPANATGYRSGLQLGIDGKIYMTESYDYNSGSPNLSVINNPDSPGTAADFQRNSITLLGGTYSRQGLPQFIQSLFVQTLAEDVCVYDTAHFQVTANRPIVQVTWDFGDGTTAVSLPDPNDPRISRTEHVYNAPGTYTVTADIEMTNNASRSISTSIEVFPLPEIQQVTPYEVCDINGNGIAEFVLHNKDAEIIGQQGYPGTYAVHYYASQADAESDVNELTDPYTNTVPYQDTVWYRLVNTVTGCFNIGELILIVHPLPEIYQVPPLEVCDDNYDGIATFNLRNAEPDILQGRDPQNYGIDYYETQADAEAGTNPIPDPTNYTNTVPWQQTVYYSITDSLTTCRNVGEFDLIVNEKPRFSMEDIIVCRDDSTYVEAPAGYAAYLWSTGDTLRGIYVHQPGTYWVEVTTDKGCSGRAEFQAVLSEPAIIDTVYVTEFQGNNNSIEVIVHGAGDYEYSLDDINYQDSNVFTGLPPGDYVVYVNDKNGCGKVSVEVHILGAPPYFSPNGDGHHEYWQIINIAARPGSMVYIYDRFGVLMYQMDHKDKGWDGTYNGIPQPSTDYWYVVELRMPDGSIKIVKGHFALIR